MRSIQFMSLLAFTLCTLARAADEPKAPERPQSPTALAAMREYDKVMKEADEVARQARLAAEHKLIDKLRVSLAAAIKAGNLADANAIDSQIKAAQERMEAASPPRPVGGGLIVKRAVWMPEGQEQKAVDLTAQVRPLVNGGTIQLKGFAGPEIVGGVHKILVIFGSYGGTDFAIRIEDSGFGNFRFGPPTGRAGSPE